MRAVQLSDPQTIDVLNKYFVTVNVDLEHVDAGDVAECARLEREFTKMLATRSWRDAKVLFPRTTTRVLRPDGKTFHLVRAGSPLAPMLTALVAALHLPVKQQNSRAPKAPPAGVVSLHVTARFLAQGDKDASCDVVLPRTPAGQPLPWSLPAPEKLYQTRLAAPTDEEFDVRTASLMCPSPATPGTVYTLPAAVVDPIFYRFTPPTHDCHPTAEEIEASNVAATVEQVHDDRVTVHLTGHVRKRHPWFPTQLEAVSLEGLQLFAGRDYHWSVCRIEGEMEYDSGGGIHYLKAVSVDGRYLGNDDSQMPFAAMLRLSDDLQEPRPDDAK